MAPKRESVKANEIKEGDEIWFPNSRHAQAVISVEHDEEKSVATLHSDEAQWQCPFSFDVDRKVSDADS